MSVFCSEPQGTRYDHVDGDTQEKTDRFSGVNPQFVFSQSNQSKLTVIWPDSKTFGTDSKQHAHEATIIAFTTGMISAVTLYEERVNLYTLFPIHGVAFMSTHKQIPIQEGIPSGAIYKMQCKFEFD